MENTSEKPAIAEAGSQSVDPSEFNDKAVAVVGNSVRIFEKPYGAQIDAHDVVVRFNLAWPERSGRPECTGSKTTHMRIGGRHFRSDEAAALLERTMREHPDVRFHSAKGDPAKWNGTAPVPLTPDDVFQRWRSEMQTEYLPSSGSGFLYYLINYCRPRAIAIFGMDGMQSPIWCKRRDIIHAPCHSPEVERSYLLKLVREVPQLSIHPPDSGHRLADRR